MSESFSNTKLIIEGYTNPNFTEGAIGTYTVMINPEGYKLNTQIELDEKQAKGTWSTNQKFVAIKPQDLAVKFTIDGSGVTTFIPSTETVQTIANGKAAKGSVQKSVDWFMKICKDMDGNTHRPNFVKIVWADLIFKGVMKSADIDYTYFHLDGTPLRAVVNATFVGSIDDKERVAKEKKSSPDVTHVHTVKKGETLSMLTYKVYGDSKYYLEVARINKLDNYRRLAPGQQLLFPAISKKEANG